MKEILYDCAVEMKATKAALFLLDVGTRKYDLVAEFGFRANISQSAGSNHPMVDRCSRGRSPFYVNSPGADPRLSELMFEASTSRLLGVPMFSRGQLVGFIDIRDKSQKQQFDQQDVNKAQAIADRILNLFANRNIWNQRFITLSDVDVVPTPRPAAEATVAPPTPAAKAAPSAPAKPSANKAVDDARAVAARLLAPAPPEPVGPAELAAVRESMRSMLLLPGLVAVMFTAAGTGQEVASRGTMSQDALSALQMKLQTWLSKRGEAGGALRTTADTPLGPMTGPIALADLQKIFTAPINSRFRGLYLTVAFADPPERMTHELLSAHLTQLEAAIEATSTRAALQTLRLRIAERLVEPENTSYPELRKHSIGVTAAVEAFVKFLGLPLADAETARLTAIVHDCGMRALEYDKLYRKRDLSHDELALLREHPVVGAAMVEPLLGADVARAVLCHHERADGAGYPNELSGDAIPLASRIVQICDAYVAITDPATYHTPESAEEALAAIRLGAGAQFDKDLASRFEEMMRARTATLAAR
ncbi:MAG TPA: HD domain-containing phosphohydrolase [Thermoanaerobaculia bacterium]|nr:HD domain-containing phosphohydrolase [Thermoanaerobaculia bacterium]